MDKTNEQNNDFSLLNENQNEKYNSNQNIQNNPHLEKDISNINNNNNTPNTPTSQTINNENKTNSIDEKKYKEMKELKESNYYKLIVKGNIIDVYTNNNWCIGKILDLNDNGDIKINLIENKNSNDIILRTNFLANQENFTYFRKKTNIENNNYINIDNEEECNSKKLEEKINLLKNFKKLKKNFSENNLKAIFEKNEPYFYFQLFNFNLIFDIDYFLNVNNKNFEATVIYIKLILEILSNYYYYILENNQYKKMWLNKKNYNHHV